MAIATPSPHLASLAVGLGVAYVLYRIAMAINTAQRRAAMAAAHGCQPPMTVTKTAWTMGYERYFKSMESFNQHTILERTLRRFRRPGMTTIQSVVMGTNMYSTVEPENLKTIQALDAKKWNLPKSRKVAFTPLLGKGVFTTDGAQWAHSREMLRPNFARSQVADLDMFETHIRHLIDAIPKDRTMVNLGDLFFRLTMDSATEFLFGEATTTLADAGDNEFALAFERSLQFVGKTSRLEWLAPYIPLTAQFKKDRALIWSVVDKCIEKGIATRSAADKPSPDSAGERYVFIDELTRQTTDRTRIRSELLNILLAGRDTTASLLTNLWFTLSNRPDLWTALQAEIAPLDGAAPTFAEIKEMKFLRALLNETLRLWPVVPLNSRQAVEDTTLPRGGGPDGMSPLFLPKGTEVKWNVYALQRRKDYYGEDADEFRPERWLDDPAAGTKGLRPGWEYLPFNGGPRICLGQQFALTEASYTTIRLCQAFAGIESRDSEPWTERLTLTCVNVNGAKVSLTPREV